MSRTVSIITPENIRVTYQLAGIASRFMATLVDLFLQFLLSVLVFLVIRLGTGADALGGAGIGGLISAAGLIALYLIWFAYALFFEALWNGRTPGKRLFGLRVIRDGGYPLTFMASATRNVLRIADVGIFPFSGAPVILCGLPGLLSIFLSSQYKRIGDYAAGTLVIIEKGSHPLGEGNAAPLAPTAAAFLPYLRNLDRLTAEEYRLLRRFVARRNDLDIPMQAALGEKIAHRLLPRLEIEVPVQFQLQYADLLEAIERRYAEEQGVL
jgi:uncharacterized RDD family membrane protein YckC